MAPAVASSRSLDPLSEEALLTGSVVKKKKKTPATSRDKPSSSLDGTESASDIKTKARSKKSMLPLKQSLDKLTHQTTSTPLSSPPTVSPVPESVNEGLRPLKKKWQGRSSQDTEKETLSEFLIDAGRKTSLKSVALGKVTLAADVLKEATGRGVQRQVKPAQPPETHKSKAPLRLAGEESGHSSPLTAEGPTVSVQAPAHMAVQKPNPKEVQHFKPSKWQAKVQTHFPEDVKTSRQVRGKDMKNVNMMDSAVSHSYKIVKTSVWDHIKDGLLSRKYGGPITLPLPRTEPVIEKAVNPALAGKVSLPQAFGSPQTVTITLESPGVKNTDFSSPHQARPIQGLLASQSGAASLKPQTTEWMSKATAGYLGMEVYRPPGRASLGPEHDWMRPSSEAQSPPKPPPDTSVSEVLGGSKRTHEPPSSLNSEQRVVALSIVPVPLAERRLGDVTLNELLPWLANRVPQSPREGVALVNNGWQWYYRRYIDVRKGGVGGIGMLLAGYCLLSYVWCYPHLSEFFWHLYLLFFKLLKTI
ncbi:hypothetical protein ACEWY4_025969 [Coilia grayii]|uniref:ATP synthase subunit f, mitochondrial n=1 Tax=Coilia grayii TaxID=363190 RepID=A0ABD1ITH2_9TELE